MQFTEYEARQQLINWAESLLDSLGDLRTAEVDNGVRAAIEQLKCDRFSIALLGKAKRGKSTLLNALLGRRDDIVAPVDKLPASCAISFFRWSHSEQANVHLKDGGTVKIAFRKIREFVTEEHNPNNSKNVVKVVVEGPFKGLEPDLELIDTPGAGSIYDYHDTLLHNLIPSVDAIIYLVTARMPMDQDEVNLLQNVRDADIRKLFFAINKVDETSPSDLEDAIQHNISVLSNCGFPVSEIYTISAKKAFLGDVAGSGIEALARDIASWLREHKGKVLAERFVARVRQIIEPQLGRIGSELVLLKKSDGQLCADLAELEQRRAKFEAAVAGWEEKFRKSWSEITQRFENSVLAARRKVLRTVSDRVDSTSVLNIGSLAKELPTLIVRAVETELRPAAEKLEQDLGNVAKDVQTTYPVIDVRDLVAYPQPVRSSMHSLESTVGGALLGGAGIGMSYLAFMASTSVTSAATTAAAAVPSGFLSWLSLSAWASSISAAGTGTVAAATQPIWIVLGGPVAWILCGTGAFVAANSWRIARLKKKDELQVIAREQVRELFDALEAEKVRPLARLGEELLSALRMRIERDLADLESQMKRIRQERPSTEHVEKLGKVQMMLQERLKSVT